MPRSSKWRQRRDASTADDVGGGHSSVREAYDVLGAAGFYAEHGTEYTNPHEQLLQSGLQAALDSWRAALDVDAHRPFRALDLACGGGEASLALESWWRRVFGDAVVLVVDACDPYTGPLYKERTGRVAQNWSFEDVANGVLDRSQSQNADALTAPAYYDLVLASFCLHLLEPPALHATLSALSRVSRLLLIATPFKRPEVGTSWLRVLNEVVQSDEFEASGGAKGSTRHRVRLRLYQQSR